MDRIENNILDTECSIVVSGELQIFQLARKLDIFAVAMPLFRKTRVELYLFLPEEASQRLENRIFLEQYHAKLSSNTWSIFLTSDDLSEILLLNELSGISSVYLEPMYLKEGNLAIDFKFHNSDLKKVSELVLDAVSISNTNISVKLNYIGPSRNVREALNTISSHFMLYAVSFACKPPERNKRAEDNPLGLKYTRFLRFPTEEENLHGIYRISGTPVSMNGVTIISESEGIYEAVTSNDVLMELSLKSNALPLARFSESQTLDGNIMIASFVTMESHLHTFVTLLDELSKKFQDWNIYIERIIPIKELIDQ
ncbi:MAG: hypothetical protein QW597_00650 [Thermoplasmataceae archaeon]